jgi:3-phenylpropionate/trans-cinnamate dioxygenase ferredoxin reductase component
MAKPVRRVVIVGAGDCGTRAAMVLRSNGFEGAITLVGDEAGEPYERPHLSKQVLVDLEPTPTPITSSEELNRLNVDVVAGSAMGIDRSAQRVEIGNGTNIGYDRLLLATGARARRPALDGDHLVLTLRTLADATRLRAGVRPGAHVLIIGGGFIGLEVAASLGSLGCQITVVEFAHRLMSRVVPAQVAAVVQERHLAAGADLRFGVGVDRLVERSDRIEATLTDGAVISCDLVMAGVGAVPNTEIGAGAGLDIDNGIAVDGRLQTSDPAIFAAGDCCSFPHPLYGGQRVRIEAWRNALDHASVAANTMIGGDSVCSSVPWFWSDQYELGLQIAGLHTAAVYDVARRRDDGCEVRFGIDHDGRVVSVSGVAEGTSIGRDISLGERLIAARATPRATLLADPAVNLRELL